MNATQDKPVRVSIVIPAYNCASTVAATIESCLQQTYKNAEIIVVNDGSTDNTATVLQSFGSKIQVINKCNGGLASARNAGVRVAVGEFIAWMDSDDLMAPDRIMLQVGALASDPNIQLVSSDFSAFENDDADFDASYIASYYSALSRLGGLSSILPRACEMTLFERAVTVRKGHVYHSLLSGNFVHPPTVMVRHGVFDKIGFFDETLRYSSDYDFILRAARTGEFAFIDAPLIRYRRSDTQLSRSANASLPLETIAILEKAKRNDPAISLDQNRLLSRRFAELHISSAKIIGPSNRYRALSLLLRSVRHELLVGRALFAFARIVIPRAIVTGAKVAWRHFVHGMNCFCFCFDELPNYIVLVQV